MVPNTPCEDLSLGEPGAVNRYGSVAGPPEVVVASAGSAEGGAKPSLPGALDGLDLSGPAAHHQFAQAVQDAAPQGGVRGRVGHPLLELLVEQDLPVGVARRGGLVVGPFGFLQSRGIDPRPFSAGGPCRW